MLSRFEKPRLLERLTSEICLYSICGGFEDERRCPFSDAKYCSYAKAYMCDKEAADAIEIKATKWAKRHPDHMAKVIAEVRGE